MARAKRGFKRRRRNKKILDRAEGFVLGRRNQFRRMIEAVDWSLKHAYIGRKARKRDFRQLWITRIGAAAAQFDMSYSRLVSALTKSGVQLDRKVLSEVAISDPKAFAAIVQEVRSYAPTA